ncbi:MAG: cytochrome P460 family protein [bacterium]
MNVRPALLALCLLVPLTGASHLEDAGDVAYPEGFRQWVHIRTGLSTKDSAGTKRLEGIHNIYANQAAMQGYLTGHFPQGAVIAFDFIEVDGGSGAEKLGGRRLVDVMAKDSTRYADTGGWGYDEFRGDTRERNGIVRASCAKCHATKQSRDYVFTDFKP